MLATPLSATVTAGTAISITVSLQNAIQPSGTIDLLENATIVASAPAILASDHTETISPVLAAGDHTLVASYHGDLWNAPVTSAPFIVHVTPTSSGTTGKRRAVAH